MKASVRRLDQWVPRSQYPFFLHPLLPSTFQLKGGSCRSADLTPSVAKDDLELQILLLLPQCVPRCPALEKRFVNVYVWWQQICNLVHCIKSFSSAPICPGSANSTASNPETFDLSRFMETRSCVDSRGHVHCIAAKQNKKSSTSTLHSKCHILDHKDP